MTHINNSLTISFITFSIYKCLKDNKYKKNDEHEKNFNYLCINYLCKFGDE